MININYSNKKIRVETEKISNLVKTPIKLEIKNPVSKEIIWKCEMGDNHWATYPNNEIFDVIIKDYNENIITERKWNIWEDGSELYKALYIFCKSKIKTPNGLVIGTHDGEFGEWVPVVLDNISNAVLIEASTPQFKKLKSNYINNTNINLIQSLITTNGQPIEFFEGGRGYTNSVVERVIKNWEKEEINSTLKPSISLNDIIIQYFPQGIDWLHLDVEGYDAKLLMSMDDTKYELPKFIIFEYENTTTEENNAVKEFLINRGYTLDFRNISCLATKL